MKSWIRILGSIRIAVPLLILIAGVLAWGTMYETRFGTAAVQRFVYTAWWFQAVLGFLALNLAAAALQRYPWKRHHIPFVLAHIGIILILIGGIIGGRFGIEGLLIIPEGQAERVMDTPGNVIVVSQADSGKSHIIPTQFESQAWVHEPNKIIPLDMEGKQIELTVDRYYPNAVVKETITGGGSEINPAVKLLMEQGVQQETFWLFSRDQERFGMGWAEAHIMFLEVESEQQLKQLFGKTDTSDHPRGVIMLQLAGSDKEYEIPVPEIFGEPIKIKGSDYRIQFKDYFPDFAITEEGLVSRSSEPNNPAVSFTLLGPEETDGYLLFAHHPEFQSMHGFEHVIDADVQYTHGQSVGLPPNTIVLISGPNEELTAVLTSEGAEQEVLESIKVGEWYEHPSFGYRFQIETYYPRAQLSQEFVNRGDEIRLEAVHVIARSGGDEAQSWVRLRGNAELKLGDSVIHVEYRPARRELPFTVKLLDFRKISYPGIDMAEEFESDIQLIDMERGIILMRKISMNNPFRYRGYSLFQASFIPGTPEVTILSVRNDPGTPVVYTGFITVIAGVVAMFVLRSPAYISRSNKGKRKRS